MVTVIQFKPVPRKKALQLVKMQNTSVKADVIKASQQAYKSGYSTDLINEDLIQAREDAGKLRHDVVNEGKKLFFATMVVSIFGKDDDEIKNITAQYTAKCADYSVTPSYLIGQQVAGLNTAILCGNSKVIIDRMLTSDNACALFPFNIQELTDKKGHFYGSNAISKNMVMYDRKRSRLANGLIFGQSGSGKSFITKGEIIPNLLDGNDDMIILDPENEYHVVAEHFGGRTIDLELKSQYHMPKESNKPLYINDMGVISQLMVITEQCVVSSNLAEPVESAKDIGFMYFVDYVLHGECKIGAWEISYKDKEFSVFYTSKGSDEQMHKELLYRALELDQTSTFKLVLYIIKKAAESIEEVLPDNFTEETWKLEKNQ